MAVQAETKPRSRIALSTRARATFTWATAHAAEFALAIAVAVSGLFFAARALQRWDDYLTNAFDLAFFDQIIWNTSRGGWFETTFIGYNFAGQHLEPVLLLFVPAYWFGAGPTFLLLAQAVAAAGAAIPLYAAGRRFRLPSMLAALVAVAYLANPYLHRALNFDFHPEVMVALPSFTAAWAIAGHRYRLAVILALSTLLFKEDAAFVALGLAAILWIEGGRREAVFTGTVALAYAALAVLVFMPLVRGGAPSDLVERYGYLAHTSDQTTLALVLLIHPWMIPQHLLAPAQLWTMAVFLSATAPFAVLRPWLLPLLLPGLAIAVLAAHPEQRHLELHYSAEVVPLATILGLLGGRSAVQRVPARVVGLGVGVVTTAAFLALSPFSPLATTHTPPSPKHVAALQEAVALVPSDRSQGVSAQSSLLPRLSRRPNAWEFPQATDRVNWVVVDRYSHRSRQSIESGYDATLARVRDTFQRVYDRDGVEVFRRIQ
jgi:uncharacterized membrane protein